MITLVRAQVWKYKSIEDSSLVDIDQAVTVLVGKNESGKTAFLEAMHKAHAADSPTKFDCVFDYPRKDYIRYRAAHDAKNFAPVVALTYSIDASLAQKINTEVFNGHAVVQAGQQYKRLTNYGNTATITLDIDVTGALPALRKPFEDIEHAPDAFEGVATLDEVVAKIEARGFPAENVLAVFAKQWRDRFAGATKGWAMLDWHVWKKYVSPATPTFLYFDDYRLLEGKINLESLTRRKNSNQLTESDETVLGLLDLAGTNLAELTSEEGYENSKAKLEAISLTVTAQVFEYWKQNTDLSVEFDIKSDPNDTPPFNAGKNLYIRIKNQRHGVTVPFDQRSKGFIWFFSFMVWFSAVEDRTDTDDALILLLDEPGLNLHALAQADLLAYIETLSKSRQVVYSTHSPFMVDGAKLERIRVVEDRPKEGTRVTSDLATSADDSVFPLQAALGYSIAQNLFIAKRNVLVEGPADLIVLQHMTSLLQAQGRQGIASAVIVPVGGLDKVATFVALLGANKLSMAVVHDRSSSVPQKLEDLVRYKLIERRRILDYAMFRDPAAPEADLEDLIPTPLYVEAFNIAYRSELGERTLALQDVGAGPPRIVQRINLWLDARGITLLQDGGFNHYRVAQALLPLLVKAEIPQATFDSFERLFAKVNSALG